MNAKLIALTSMLVFCGIGLSVFFAGKTTVNADGTTRTLTGSYSFKAKAIEGETELVMISLAVPPGTGTAGSDFLLRFMMTEYRFEFPKITQFFGEDSGYVYVLNENTTEWDLTACNKFDFDAAQAQAKAAGQSMGFVDKLDAEGNPTGDQEASFFGQTWDLQFGADGNPTVMGPYNIIEFQHEGDGEFPDYWVDRAHPDDVCTELGLQAERRRLERKANDDDRQAGHKLVEKEEELLTKAANTRDLVARRALEGEARELWGGGRDENRDRGSHEQSRSCGWYNAVQDIKGFVNRGFAGTCKDHYYTDANRGWETFGEEGVSSDGDERIRVCNGVVTATGKKLTMIQQWGTGGGQDIMRDLLVLPSSGCVHMGARWEAENFYDSLISHYPIAGMAQDVLVSGFSLGGASAHVLAAKIRGDGKNVKLFTGGEFAAFQWYAPFWCSGIDRPLEGNDHHRVIAGRDGVAIWPEWDPTPGITKVFGYTGFGTAHWAIEKETPNFASCSGCSGCSGCGWGGCSGCSGCSGCTWSKSYNSWEDKRSWPYYSPFGFLPLGSVLNFAAGLIREADGSAQGPMMHFFDYDLHIQKSLCGLGGGRTTATYPSSTNFLQHFFP